MKYLKISSACLLLALGTACGGGGSSGSTNSGSSGAQNTNTAPVASGSSETLIQDSTITIQLQATDADGDNLTYSINTDPSNGTAVLTNNMVEYTPSADYAGSDSFTFIARDGQDNSNAATVDLTIQPASKFEGRIRRPNRDDVPGAVILALDSDGVEVSNFTADMDGLFELKAVTEQDLVLKVSAEGYTDQFIPVTMPSLKSMTLPLDVVLLERSAPQTFDAGSGGTLTDANGASLKIEPNSFVDSNGAAISGDVSVSITPVDVSNPQVLAAFPGEFTGIEETNGMETAIVSLGTVEYVFTQNGAPVQLSDGSTAEIELPIFSTANPQTGERIALGDSIELWSLTEDTGIWLQEGFGTVVVNTDSPTGLALRATVSHFTWWNCDISVNRATVDVTVTGTTDTGAAIIHAQPSGRLAYRTGNRNVTVGDTVSGLIIPAGETTCFWIEYIGASGGSGFSPDQCVDNAIVDANYPLTFSALEDSELSLNGSVNYQTQFFSGKNVDIQIHPRSLETDVTYAVTAGTLPTGVTLSGHMMTSALLSGSSTELGDYSVTIEGTDSDGFTDRKVIEFSIVDLPPATLSAPATIYANVGDNISQAVTVQTTAADAPTSWIVTNTDGSPVPAGVTISGAGVFSVDNYSGDALTYSVTAYNNKGASNMVEGQTIGPGGLTSRIEKKP